MGKRKEEANLPTRLSLQPATASFPARLRRGPFPVKSARGPSSFLPPRPRVAAFGPAQIRLAGPASPRARRRPCR
jgi:hypothetical protein